ncbi:MAG: RNA methyltransferase [Nitrospirota bacterium]|nr:RNA methyltransferase [Nitrospirota bacterium]
MKSWKDNISFILIEPREPGNIGASARAMKNMGFKNLELVTPGYFFTSEAKQMACQGVTILENAMVHKSFTDAIKYKNLIIGTTRRLGRRRGLIVPLKESVKRIIAAAKKNKVAILFGRERNGLTNKEVEKCGLLITIPADPETPSLNLAQSVLLVAYELSHKTYKTEAPVLAKHEELETLYKHINSALNLLEYIPRGNRDLETKIMRNLKHLIGRAGLTDWELKMLHGICSQIEKKIKGSETIT